MVEIQNSVPDVPVILVGTKFDLSSQIRPLIRTFFDLSHTRRSSKWSMFRTISKAFATKLAEKRLAATMIRQPDPPEINRSRDRLRYVPREVLVTILEYCEMEEVNTWCCVSRAWYHLAAAEDMWQVHA